MRAFAFAILIAGLLFGSPVGAELRWHWSFDGEAGTFLTDGDSNGFAVDPGTHTILDFSVDSSQIGFEGSLSAGDFEVNQPTQGFLWDGVAPTEFFRSSGNFTNGSNFFVAGRDEFYGFNPDDTVVRHAQTFEESAAGPLSMGPILGCGDGYIDAESEVCDDGNDQAGDGCSATCQLECPEVVTKGCIRAREGFLTVKERLLGEEKFRAVMERFRSEPDREDFGDPIDGASVYHTCIYDEDKALVGQLTLDAADSTCAPDDRACWRETKEGLRYDDPEARVDGFRKVKLERDRIVLKADNHPDRPGSSYPPGLAFGLSGHERARLQLHVGHAGEGACFDLKLKDVSRADGEVFRAERD